MIFEPIRTLSQAITHRVKVRTESQFFDRALCVTEIFLNKFYCYTLVIYRYLLSTFIDYTLSTCVVVNIKIT